jgi:hypothetical protein
MICEKFVGTFLVKIEGEGITNAGFMFPNWVLLMIQVIFSMKAIRYFEASENIAPTYTATSQKL